MGNDKDEDYDYDTLRKKIKRVDSLIKDEVPQSPGHARLERKRAKYVKQISQKNEWKREHGLGLDEDDGDVPMPPPPERTESLMMSIRESEDDPTPAKKATQKSYDYETLEKKIALVESLMKDEDDSFSDEFKKLERKKEKYVVLLKATDKWKELHPDGDSDDEEEDLKDASDKESKDDKSKDTESKSYNTDEEEDDFDDGAIKSLMPGTVPDEIRLGGEGGYQLTDMLDDSTLSPEQIECKEMLLKLMKLNGEKPGTEADLDEDFLITLCGKVSELFLKDPMVLRLKAPIKICADIHGQFYDLLRIFDYGDYPSKSDYLFLGDYVDRGKQSVEVVAMLFGFKFLFPEKMHMLRGNHEISSINRIYGFHDECSKKYSGKLYKAVCKAFNCLPVVAVIEETVVCMHAGISPSLMDLDEVNKMERPCEIPEEGWLCDFVWSDPDPDVTVSKCDVVMIIMREEKNRQVKQACSFIRV